MDNLLPARGIGQDLCLPVRLYLAAGVVLAAAQAPENQLEGATPPLPARPAAGVEWSDAVQPGGGDNYPIPLQGNDDPFAVDDGRVTVGQAIDIGSWRARCSANGDAGFGGRAGETGR